MPKPTLSLEIVVKEPVPGVRVGLQRGKASAAETVQVTTSTEADLLFPFEVTVIESTAATARFGGPYIQSDDKGQFVYLRWGQSAGDHFTDLNRRTKVYLSGVTVERIRQGGTVTLTIAGKMKDGSPACATVPVTVS